MKKTWLIVTFAISCYAEEAIKGMGKFIFEPLTTGNNDKATAEAIA